MRNIEEKRIALLIDADNVSSKYAKTIFDELNKYGDIIIRRIYGDWSNNTIREWLDLTQQYALKPIMQENNTPGKNASDICLVIDAMKLLHEGKADIFCIISSDSDFTLLAKEIRENGIHVIGMGESKTPESFVKACRNFVILDMIGEESSEENIEESSEENIEESSEENIEENSEENIEENSEENIEETSAECGDKDTPAERNTEDALTGDESGTDTAFAESRKADRNILTDKKLIEKAIIEIIQSNDSKEKHTEMGEIGSKLLKSYPEFDVRNYGYSKLSTFVKDVKGLEVKENGRKTYIELKDTVTDKKVIEKTIFEIIQDNDSKGKRTGMGEFGSQLLKKCPNFNVRNYGYNKLSTFIKSFDNLIVSENGKGQVYIELKPENHSK